MSEPLSVSVGVCLGYAALAAYTRNSSAVSTEAAAARRSASVVVALAEGSQALFGDKAAAISELFAMADGCAAPDWDGEGAAGMNPLAVATAEDFVRVLPENVPLPEFAPEPDGSVSLDWGASRHRRFTVSVGGSNRLAFAWLDGTDKGHGVARFDGTTIPSRILEGIKATVNHANASLRVA